MDNCTKAMEAARDLLGIPMVVSPEDFASETIDDFSAMTYLSYFMTVDSCGYRATLEFVRRHVTRVDVNNFDVSVLKFKVDIKC